MPPHASSFSGLAIVQQTWISLIDWIEYETRANCHCRPRTELSRRFSRNARYAQEENGWGESSDTFWTRSRRRNAASMSRRGR